jgi:hypothetical protein
MAASLPGRAFGSIASRRHADDYRMERITDDAFEALLGWVTRERAIDRLMQRGKLGFGEMLLRRQMNYDRLLRESRVAR